MAPIPTTSLSIAYMLETFTSMSTRKIYKLFSSPLASSNSFSFRRTMPTAAAAMALYSKFCVLP